MGMCPQKLLRPWIFQVARAGMGRANIGVVQGIHRDHGKENGTAI